MLFQKVGTSNVSAKKESYFTVKEIKKQKRGDVFHVSCNLKKCLCHGLDQKNIFVCKKGLHTISLLSRYSEDFQDHGNPRLL